ncbi:hypothetical protein MKW98_030198 [Papaver atlanticum]|uniref:Uncharacterized protein n=1 Tax=Papaver atlanticum TaxID=357466 RepID=A0AAD4SSY0_9MAGN|nr:hypothetical protein MKW98_030198 [Papaver atlanticum]
MVGRNEAQTSVLRTNDVRGFRRLRKTHQDYHPHCMNRDAGFLNRNVIQIPDAMSEKVCEIARRSQRLCNKNYNFIEESVCASSGGFFPSPFLNLNVTGVPIGREAMRGNDFSNTVFIDDSSPMNVLSHVLSDHGLLGSGSTSPRLANESARVRRPPSIPVPDVDDGMVCQPPSISVPNVDGGMMRQPPSIPAPDVDGGNCPSSSRTPALPVKEPDYESLQNAVTEYYTQRLITNVLWPVVLMLMESKNTELSAAIRVLTEELAGARQELANSKSRELQLQLYFEEIGDVLPDSWEY